MRLRFDQPAKQLACATLEGTGTVTTDAETTPDAQRADVRFEPDPTRTADRAKLGLLGRLTNTPCLLEFFSSAPSTDEVRACLSKHLTFWHARAREARNKKRPMVSPMLWILSAGRPVSALNAFDFVPARGFPAGVYRGSVGLRVGIVVASELARDRSTLLVRLMAGGRGLPEAMQDLSALPPDAPEQATATPVLLRLNTELTGKRRPTREEREFIMSTQNIVQELLEKGRHEGRLEEARAALRSVLTRRGLSPSAEDEAKIDACTRTATLRRWHDQAIDSASAAEALK